jgi:hypothetical protein
LDLEMHLQQKKNLNMEPSQARVYCGIKNSWMKVKNTTYVAKLEHLASVLIISLSRYSRPLGIPTIILPPF